jgi:hypothetical protein
VAIEVSGVSCLAHPAVRGNLSSGQWLNAQGTLYEPFQATWKETSHESKANIDRVRPLADEQYRHRARTERAKRRCPRTAGADCEDEGRGRDGPHGPVQKDGRGMRRGMMHGMHMRLIMILMDSDGDGALSLEEFQ